jgi:hypothetical protein
MYINDFIFRRGCGARPELHMPEVVWELIPTETMTSRGEVMTLKLKYFRFDVFKYDIL